MITNRPGPDDQKPSSKASIHPVEIAAEDLQYNPELLDLSR